MWVDTIYFPLNQCIHKGHLYPVDILAGNPEVIQEAAEAYYEKLLQRASSSPEFFSIPGGEKVKLEDSCVRFLPVYREDPKYKILVLTDPQAKERVLAIYLNQSWWPIEDIVKTADSSREGLIQVQTSGERIVLFVLNSIIFGMLERSSANDTFFVSHSAKESAKIFWRNGDAVAFYTVKIKVLDTVFVRRKYRRCGLGMKILHDFCQSFVTEDALGISCPISADMYQVCQKFLQTHPEEQNRLWEVEAPGDWSQRVSIWLKIQLELALSEKNTVHQTASEEEGGCQVERAQDDDLRHLDAGQMNEGGECIPDIRKVPQEARDDKDNTAGEARSLHLQVPKEEDFSQGTADTQQCKGSRKRASTMGLPEDKTTKHLRMMP
ncbi:protein FAM169B-like isoform X3 [Mauremys reevesii]|uniref:protein FAM169B-like isoform X3 n=1 Tax=Mauremys reevesii TaxID=260615 RepID=UPI00193FFA9F|nr:protein FAM169B-like isoform X3 [Mauremys reevesii]